jgi:Domain of unknown function (DUF4168)
MKASRTIAAMAALLIAAALPTAAQQTSPAPVQQGEMSDAMVSKVGTALRHVAMIRQQYSQRAQGANTPQQQQTLSDQARSEMLKAISDQGLSVQQYQQAIQMAQNNETLKQRLLSAAQSGD